MNLEEYERLAPVKTIEFQGRDMTFFTPNGRRSGAWSRCSPRSRTRSSGSAVSPRGDAARHRRERRHVHDLRRAHARHAGVRVRPRVAELRHPQPQHPPERAVGPGRRLLRRPLRPARFTHLHLGLFCPAAVPRLRRAARPPRPARGRAVRAGLRRATVDELVAAGTMPVPRASRSTSTGWSEVIAARQKHSPTPA